MGSEMCIRDSPGPERYRSAGHGDRGTSPPGQRPGPSHRPTHRHYRPIFRPPHACAAHSPARRPVSQGDRRSRMARGGGDNPIRRRSAVPVDCEGYRSGPGHVFHEKAPNVNGRLAADLIAFGRSVPESSIRTLREPYWARCMRGYHRCGAAISTSASKAVTSQRSRRKRGLDLSNRVLRSSPARELLPVFLPELFLVAGPTPSPSAAQHTSTYRPRAGAGAPPVCGLLPQQLVSCRSCRHAEPAATQSA